MNENFQRETVYQAGSGFYRPYVEPLWKKEKREIRKVSNGIGLAALGYVAVSLGAGIFSVLITEFVLPNLTGTALSESIEWLMTFVIYVVSLLLPFGLFALFTKIPLKVALPFRKARFDLTLGGVFIGLGISIIASYATAYLQMGLEAVGIGITMPELGTPQTLPGILLYFLCLAVAPAFVEEMVFRGIIMQNLRRFGDVFAIFASALIFGIFHLNLIQMPYAFILGLGIGYFVMRTGSLWVGVFIHFINNFAACVFELLSPYMSEEVYITANYVYNLLFAILGVIFLAVVLSKYRNIFRFAKRESSLSAGKRTLYFITAPALIVALLLAAVLTLPYIYLI